MRITQELDYALRVIAFLSSTEENKVEARKISYEEKIPLRFLLKLLGKLAASNIVKSFRGANGGYSLNMLPEEITLKKVYEAIEGEIYINKCMEDPHSCNLGKAEQCKVHKALYRVQRVLIQELESINFKDILEDRI
ncbi:RrF2 family transcriptional regulator [Clostridium polynesiense]|uniref:RrF2 family transcriptional regulator n=1 Tax=Clostridium polynesiense TaxID=1325933 RepID=UPI00058CB48B|nr:Rrf2 family transcriptional regulator [Clostridium polynesiense]